ncbi:MAG: ribonuclease H-like domain-containing protein [Myxococcota bacterium]|nr:ribonuclease H-like domain-containing protein [Myxococcota bacterium]
MSKLLTRLRRRFGEADEPAGTPAREDVGVTDRPAPEREDVLARLRRQIEALDRRWKPEPASLPETRAAPAGGELPGRMVETPCGPVRLISATAPRSHLHGRFAIGSFAGGDADLGALRRLYRLSGPPDPERLVFLDTETTGLSGGAGTLPFLVGLAWLDGGDLRIEQFFLDHPRQEPAMILMLRDRLARFEHVVSYNGRSFDVPLVQNRFVLHRTPFPPIETALDLLPGCRRLHRHHLDDRSLGSIERHVLGFERRDDVPGAEIPGIYRRYLMTRRPERLAEVIRHNVWDVVAMAALVGLHARLLSGGPGAAEDPAVDVALGEIAWAAHEFDRAAAHLECAIGRLSAGPNRADIVDLVVRANRTLAFVHRRRGRHDLAAACWTAILAAKPDEGQAHLGLAKHHEHRTGDLAAAERHGRLAAQFGAEGGEDAVRRIERIRRRSSDRFESAGDAEPRGRGR